MLTQPLRFNFGGILQNYALQTILRRMGHEVVTLDPKRYIYPRWKHPFVIMRHLAARYLKGYKEVKILNEYNKDKETRKIGINTFKFIDRYINRKAFSNLHKEISPKDNDVFIVGSDQVWRHPFYGREGNMFLDFAEGWDVRRIAYAASFGTDEISYSEEQICEYRRLLSLFDAVSVREESAVALCSKYLKRNAIHVLDPTLLLTADDYMKLVKAYPCEKKQGDLYYYILDENEENKNLIIDFAQEKGMTPFTYCNKVLCWKHQDIDVVAQYPVELWLKGFEQAEYVITDSFHACVFSILFKKQFFVYGNVERGITRYSSLFRMLGIEDRFVKDVNDIHRKNDIDYTKVHDTLNRLRKRSISFLDDALA